MMSAESAAEPRENDDKPTRNFPKQYGKFSDNDEDDTI